jgi:NodT family efflux transporter outer membrane factor (OMF) lipoprotein
MPMTKTSAFLLATTLLAGCAVGPNYVRPSAPTPLAFKEAQGWQPAQPADASPRGEWWAVFDDPVLDQLERQVVISNQNLAAAEAAYRQATAAVAEQRAALFPTVDLTGSGTRSSRATTPVITTSPGGGGGGSAPGTGVSGAGAGARNNFQLSGSASWEPDLWGKIRRQIEGAKAQAQASEADIANARLSAQSQLAIDYFQLRADDEIKRLTDTTIEGYRRSLQISQNRYNTGVTAKGDVLTAQTQLANAEAQSADLVRQRQALEHAIAVLTGQPPANLTIAPAAWTLKVPDVPPEVPSELLQRRPDIAASERAMAAANAQIGVQISAFFPTVTLSGQGGFASSSLGSLIGASTSFWSLGASAAQTLLDFGARSARVHQARAGYDQAVAQYRQTVLSAFQEVEDDLVASRVLAQEAPLRTEASNAADGAETIALNQYHAGLADYTTVVVAQAAALNARQTLVSTQASRLTTAVQLITAMGGGWSTSQSVSVADRNTAQLR